MDPCILDVVHDEVDVWWDPVWLDGREIYARDFGAGKGLADYARSVPVLLQLVCPRPRTFDSPVAKPGAQVDDLLRVVADRCQVQLAAQEVLEHHVAQ